MTEPQWQLVSAVCHGLDDQTETLYRIAQEALHNVVKHAGASSIQVNIQRTNDVVELSIKDDGRGFQPDRQFPGHLGLKSMRERAAASGGSLVIQSVPGEGTTVRLTVPVGGE